MGLNPDEDLYLVLALSILLGLLCIDEFIVE
jgi:hypothetical protein